MRTIRLHMTPLRQRMLEDMQLRNYSPLTIDCYLRCVADFARHFGASPEHLGPEQVRTSQLFLVQDKQVSWTSVVQTVCALRFFYRVTLGRPGMLEYIPHPRRPFTLPTLLSQAEVAALLTVSRGYQMVAKISHSGWVRKLRQAIGSWQPTSSPGREIAAVLTPHRFCRATHQWVIRTPKEKGGSQYAVLVTTLTDLDPVALADAYDGRAMIEATFCQDKQALGLGGTPPAQVGGSADGAAVGSPGPSCASMGQTVAQSGAYHAATAAGLWPGAVAPRCLGSPQSYPMAARVDGQCALLTPSPARNPSSGGLFYALSRACAGGVFALKPDSCDRGARGCLGAGRARYPARWRHERPLGASPGGRRLSLMVPFPRPVPACGTHFAHTRDRVP